jgi:pimeloyl-ACP methyl ester carboxylesterase
VDEPLAIPVAAGPVVLAARSWPGGGARPSARPVLLVHGLASNARLWDGVAGWLAEEGHPVVAVDLRGHGSSAEVPDPTDGPGATLVAAADLAAVCVGLGWRSPIVVGQSWGGNVVLQLAADHPELVHGLVLVDGGWLHLGDRWPTLDAAWVDLAPPVLDGLTADDVRGRLRAGHRDWSAAAVEATVANLRVRADGTVTAWLERGRHRRIVQSLLEHRPRDLYPRVRCRTLLLAALGPDGEAIGARRLLDEAVAALPHAELVEFPGADHDLHAQHPERVAKLIATL